MESVWKPNVEISPNCPRCGSSNTKFCYYNNYSLTQPRYFCKGCRRYWTKGGSLRNVPVGGGCRKNRRGNKTLRQSIECLTFKNSPCGDAPNGPICHSYDPRRTSSSSSSVVADGPNIDLALVYANFLNQKPNSGEGVENNSDQLQPVFDPSLENSRLSNTEGGPSTNLPEEFGLNGCINLPEQPPSIEPNFGEGNNQMYLSGFNSMQMHQRVRIEQCSNHNSNINFELPPLPGDEEASHDLMWSNPEMMVNHAFQASDSPFFGPEVHDADLLIGNWSPFGLPRDASFPRP